MLHRKKCIGKSLYTIISTANGYHIQEVYCGFDSAISKEHWDNVDDAIRQLELINREGYYTDDFFKDHYII